MTKRPDTTLDDAAAWRAIAVQLATATHALWKAEATYVAQTGRTHATLRENTRAAIEVERALAAYDHLLIRQARKGRVKPCGGGAP
jgi:hypothetical protein